MLPVLYGILYGAIVAGAYLFISIFGHTGGLSLFGLSSAAIFLGHLALWPRKTSAGLLNYKMCIRGILFGLTQVLIFKAQSLHHTSTALVASTMGSFFGVVLGRLILKEKVKGWGLVGTITCCVAIFSNPSIILNSGWGVLGGFIQGLSIVLARSIILDQKSSLQAIPIGFLMSGIVALGFLAIDGQLAAGFRGITLRDLGLTALFALTVQYAFFHLYRVLDSQRASALLLTRIPWSLTWEFLFFNSIPGVRQLAAAALICIGSVFLILDARGKNPAQQT